MLRVNDLPMNSLAYRRTTDDQLCQIHQATLEILEDIGVRFQDAEALEIFRRGGAMVDDNVVHIPSWRVEWALRCAPKRLTLFNQNGDPAIHLQGRVSYYGNGSDLPYIIDHRTGERRLAIQQDVVEIVRVLDHLENVDFVMSGFLPRDVPVEKAEVLLSRVVSGFFLVSQCPGGQFVDDGPGAGVVCQFTDFVEAGREAARQQGDDRDDDQ